MTVERYEGLRAHLEGRGERARVSPDEPGSPSLRLFVAAVVVFAVMLASAGVVAAFSYLR